MSLLLKWMLALCLVYAVSAYRRRGSNRRDGYDDFDAQLQPCVTQLSQSKPLHCGYGSKYDPLSPSQTQQFRSCCSQGCSWEDIKRIFGC